MPSFLEVVVKYRRGKGLLGKCQAHYGTVEAQGGGTLRCHLLLWLEGNPSPQQLRDRMADGGVFRETMFSWLEDLIRRELPGTTEPVAYTAMAPTEDEDANDCRVERPPGREFNFCHVHTDACFKNLKAGGPRSDGNCRMRINGKTLPHTQLDGDTLSIQLRRLRPWINSYNGIILFLLQSNVDVKFIGSGPGAKALAYCIADCITKSDLKTHAGIHTLEAAMKSHAIKFNDDSSAPQTARDRNLITKRVNMPMGRQEVSHQQVMSYPVGGGGCCSSHEFRSGPAEMTPSVRMEFTAMRNWKMTDS
ncbi:hypothetical protein L210DRAFT_961723 [Boletus edulis BED1]|uniref:Helitron helicase-like domain-containing protein n=1 Tax=Boletus edulis BED1 TaxID=1328754 RepID=A0AAD4BG11_BOLED|nr:hypothetical protein L210DRAFT_961723 [Boletus edulis BED1]